MVTPERYHGAPDFAAYVAGVEKNREFWEGLLRTLPLPAEVVARATALRRQWRLLVLSEDWCSDAVSIVPILAKLAAAVEGLELKVLARDRNDDLMQRHLTNGTRSIPVVMALDTQLVEHAWWGPRPSVLQQWFLTEGASLDRLERSRRKREWYARDRGRTTLEEVVAMLEQIDG